MRVPILHSIKNSMKRTFKTTAILVGMVTLCLQAQADGLKTLKNPDGGWIVYGPLPTDTSLADGMGKVLHTLHEHFGERPQIGRFFRTHGSNSVATFFTLHAKSEDGRQIAGMALVSIPSATDAAAAVIYDDANHFGKTADGMLKQLDQVLKPSAASSGPRSASRTAAPAPARPLQNVTFPDNSGTIGLPEGWSLTSASAGAVHAVGPDGESVHLGVLVQNIYDPRNPKAASMLRYMNMAHKPAFVCPYGGNLYEAMLSISQQMNRFTGTPAPSYHLIESQPTQPNQYEGGAITFLAELDDHKGHSSLLTNQRLGALKVGPGGMWAMAIYAINIPKERVQADLATVMGIVQSYRQNGAVLMAQSNAIIAQIHANMKANEERMAAFHAANDARNGAIDQARDNQDLDSKRFQNYQFDRAVVRETTTDAHGTFDYRTADFLVKTDPNHFEYVQTPDFKKGIDY